MGEGYSIWTKLEVPNEIITDIECNNNELILVDKNGLRYIKDDNGWLIVEKEYIGNNYGTIICEYVENIDGEITPPPFTPKKIIMVRQLWGESIISDYYSLSISDEIWRLDTGNAIAADTMTEIFSQILKIVIIGLIIIIIITPIVWLFITKVKEKK